MNYRSKNYRSKEAFPSPQIRRYLIPAPAVPTLGNHEPEEATLQRQAPRREPRVDLPARQSQRPPATLVTVTSKSEMATCGCCGQPFHPPAGRGPTPKYCSRSHRQRAYEARQQAATADLQTLAEVLEATRAEVARATTRAALAAAYQRLAAAAGQLLGEEAPASPAPPHPHGPVGSKAVASRSAGPTPKSLDEPAVVSPERVTVPRSRRGRRPPSPTPPEDPTLRDSTAITLKGLSPSQVNAARRAGATTTKTTATFVGDPAIILDRIRWAGAAKQA